MPFEHDEWTMQLHDPWRARLSEARSRYDAEKTPGNRQELRRILSLFTDMVMRGKTPDESPAKASTARAAVGY